MSALRLLGVWIIDPDLQHRQAITLAYEGLAGLCAGHDVLPAGNPATAIFTTRRDTLPAAVLLDVPIPRLLALTEKLGYDPDRTFIAAAVDVTPIGLIHSAHLVEVAA